MMLNNSYPRQISMKSVHIGDIWLAEYNYTENGNYGKIRPVLIVDFDDENELILVRRITSKNKGKKIPFQVGKKEIISYLTNDYIKVPRYYLIRRLKSYEEIREYKLNEIK